MNASIERISGSKHKLVIAAWVLLILAVNLWVFFPSFAHIWRGGDQFDFITFLTGFDNLGDMLGSTCSYPRIAMSDRGDAFLFRPLFYVFLTLEYWIFRLNFFWWQIVGFCLHVLVVWKLADVLWKIRPTQLVFPIALNFSVLLVGMEMVIWQHINGYLLCLLVILFAFDRLVLCWRTNEFRERDLAVMAALLTLASFIYEVGLVSYLIFAGFLFATMKKASAVTRRWFLFPLAVYFLTNAVDYFFINRVTASTFQFARHFSWMKFGNSLSSVVTIALSAWLLPVFDKIYLTLRLFFSFETWPQIIQNLSIRGGAYSISVLLNALLIVMAGFSLILLVSAGFGRNFKVEGQATSPDHLAQRAGNLAGTIFGVFVLMVSLRSAGHSASHYHLLSLYNFYVTGVFLTILLYCWGIRSADTLSLPKQGLLKFLVTAALILSIGLNATHSHVLNQEIGKIYQPWKTFFARLNEFVDRHKSEPDFTFHILWRQPVKMPQYGDYGLKDRFVQRYFARYLGSDSPKYYLLYYYREGILSFPTWEEADRYARIHSSPPAVQNPPAVRQITAQPL